jgi:ribosomal protein RSM22 (predicted rRNA methylase)
MARNRICGGSIAPSITVLKLQQNKKERMEEMKKRKRKKRKKRKKEINKFMVNSQFDFLSFALKLYFEVSRLRKLKYI